MSKLELMVDKVKITGPRVDGGYSITLDVGEYEQDKVASLVTIPQGEPVKITVEMSNG